MSIKSRFIVLGSSNMDLISYTPRIPKSGETIIGSKFETRFGGKGANQAVMLSKLVDEGQDIVFVSKVGNDSFGKDMLDQLKQYNLDTTYVSVQDNCSSGIASINIDADGHNNIIVIPGANFEITNQDIDKCVYLNSKATIPTYLIIQFEIPMNTICYALKKAKENNIVTIVNPAPASTLFPKEMLSYCDYFCPNETELELMINHFDSNHEIQCNDVKLITRVYKYCEYLCHQGVNNLIITLGDHGVYYYNTNESFLIPCFPVNVVDTVGAGDCFIGSFTYYLSKHYSVEQCLLNSNYVASLSVSRYGAQKSYPTKHELDDKYK